VTTIETPVAETAASETAAPVAPSGPGDAGDAVPPTPTPTPPILPPPPPKPKETSYLGRITIGLVLVSLGVLAILDNIPGIPIEPQPRHYIALATVVVGLGLIVGGFIGRARWLILIGALLVPTLLFSPVFEYEWNTDEFDRTVSPDTFTELEDSYALEVGNLVIDLTDLPWDGETVDLVARVDAGNIEIWIPPGVGLEGEASVDVGHVGAFGRESSGLGGPTLEFDTPGPAGTVVLDATVDLGNIDIQIVGR